MNRTKLFIIKYLKFKNKFIRNYGAEVYEPIYLESLKPSIPLYDTINIQIKGYDYPVVENYQKFIHNVASNMDIEVSDSWAVPPQEFQIVTYKPHSEVVKAQYKLKLYERTIQIEDVISTRFPIFLRLIKSSLPPGVNVDVVNHDDSHEEVRYVPDKELLDLKQQLEDIGGETKKK